MPKFNDIEDIIAYAIGREEDALKMYIDLAGKIRNPQIKKVLHDFAAEELQHKQKLQFELLNIGKTSPISTEITIITPDEADIDQDSLIDIDYSDALIVAIKKEEIAFQLYSELASKVKNYELKSVFYQLAEEEVRHKILFEKEYEKITQPPQ
jgi:rubrerythrin